MFMYAVKKPAAAALGEDGTAVFCEGPGALRLGPGRDARCRYHDRHLQ